MAATSFAFAFAFATAGPVADPAAQTALAFVSDDEAGPKISEEAPSPGVLITTEPIAAPPPPGKAEAETKAPETADEAFLDEIKEPSDPLEFFNRPSFAVSMALDKAIIRPAAMTYRAILPRPARDGIRNGLSNIGEPLVFANDVLQLRPKRALRTLGRFVINTILGTGGLFDIAKRTPFNLPHRTNGFGNTLGYYGIGPGPYLYIPVLGPTTIRDGAAQFADSYASPRLLGSMIHPNNHGPFLRNKLKLGTYGTAMTIVGGLDQRERSDAELKALLDDSIDPYASLRSSFLQDRAGEIAALKAKDQQAPVSPVSDAPLSPTSDTAALPTLPPSPQPPMEQAESEQPSEAGNAAQVPNEQSGTPIGLIGPAQQSQPGIKGDAQQQANAVFPRLFGQLSPFAAQTFPQVTVRAETPHHPKRREQPCPAANQHQGILFQPTRKRPAMLQNRIDHSETLRTSDSFQELVMRAGAYRRAHLAADVPV